MADATARAAAVSRIRPCPARAVPVAAALVYIVLALIQFAGLPGRTMDFLQIAIMVLLIGFVAVVWRRH